jgi:hypothetical protein
MRSDTWSVPVQLHLEATAEILVSGVRPLVFETRSTVPFAAVRPHHPYRNDTIRPMSARDEQELTVRLVTWSHDCVEQCLDHGREIATLSTPAR